MGHLPAAGMRDRPGRGRVRPAGGLAAPRGPRRAASPPGARRRHLGVPPPGPVPRTAGRVPSPFYHRPRGPSRGGPSPAAPPAPSRTGGPAGE